MVQLVLPNDILNDTPADATLVEQNYNFIESHVNQHLINKDGSVGMEAQLHLVGDPVSVLDAATKGYVDAILPVGIMLPYCASSTPAGGHWAICNGASLIVAAYPKLYAVLGTSFGTGGTGTFKLPDMAGRIPVGLNSTKGEFNTVGKAGGTHVIPVPLHNHPMPHTHEHPHTHTINHNHPTATTTGTGVHTHGVDTSVRQSAAAGTTSSFMRAASDGTTANITTNPVISDGAHTHTLDLPVTTGLVSGQPDDATTGGVSTANTSNTGTASAEHLPPYVTIIYIIRID